MASVRHSTEKNLHYNICNNGILFTCLINIQGDVENNKTIKDIRTFSLSLCSCFFASFFFFCRMKALRLTRFFFNVMTAKSYLLDIKISLQLC